MKKIILFIAITFAWNSFSQNNTRIILSKSNSPNNLQEINYSKNYPNKWIENLKKQGYIISRLNHDGKNWFIAMKKVDDNNKQKVLMNPKNDVVKELGKDGYVITDATALSGKNYLVYYILMTKISTTPQSNYYYYGSSSQKWNLIKTYKAAKKQSPYWRIRTAKSFKKNNYNFNLIVLRKYPKSYSWKYAFRTNFPDDYIDNKRVEGFMPAGLTYDNYRKKWLIIMNKGSFVPKDWEIFELKPNNFNNLKSKLRNGYIIQSVL